MTGPADPTLDRLLRQEAWATAKMFEHLRSLPEATLGATAPSTDWDVATTLVHIVDANAAYTERMEGHPDPADFPKPATHADLDALERRALSDLVRIRALAADPTPDVVEAGEETWTYPRSLLLAQALYHSIEHRAQLYGILAANGVGGLTLDDMDHWSFADHEGEISKS